MRVRVELDDATTRRLVRLAVRERRNVHWQAEVLLRDLLAAREDLAGPLPPPKEVRHDRVPTSPPGGEMDEAIAEAYDYD